MIDAAKSPRHVLDREVENRKRWHKKTICDVAQRQMSSHIEVNRQSMSYHISKEPNHR